MSYVRFSLAICIIFLSACGQGESHAQQIEEDEQIEEARDVSTMSIEPSFLSFSWIEQGFNGVFEPLDVTLGVSSDEILAQFGEPKKVGYYEGGEYWNYGEASLFLNAQNKQCVAVAFNIAEHQLVEDDLKRALGTPDETEIDDLEGFRVIHYYLDDYELFFEADVETNQILYAWLHERK